MINFRVRFFKKKLIDRNQILDGSTHFPIRIAEAEAIKRKGYPIYVPP